MVTMISICKWIIVINIILFFIGGTARLVNITKEQPENNTNNLMLTISIIVCICGSIAGYKIF